MNIQFITNISSNKSAFSNQRKVSATFLNPKGKSPPEHNPVAPVHCAKSDRSSSPSLQSAPSEPPLTPVDYSPGPAHLADADHSLGKCSFADPPSKKISNAWRKTFDDYFKSDDEDILSSGDEWWLGSRKRITDQEETPSGKTRLSKTSWQEKLCAVSDGTHDSDTDSTSMTEAPELLPYLPTQTALSSNFTSFPTSQSIPTLSDSNFPPLAGTTLPQPKPKSDQTSWRNSSRTEVSPAPSAPWSMMASSGKKILSTPAFPSLPSSSAQPLPARSAPRLICSFSSVCQRPSETKSSDAPLVVQREKNPKKTLASSREESLRSSLPAFKLQDPSFSPVTVSICPSAQHPLSELPELIHSVCSDGIALPSGKAELEGGPFVAIAFDMEWEISYTRGHENKTAIIQLASPSQALIIQLSTVGTWYRDGIMPQCLFDFLIDPQIVKLGVGIRNDGLKLLRDHKYGPKPYLNSFLELSRLTKSLGPLECASGYYRLMSLQQIVADHLKVYLPKNTARISDWTRPLSLTQLDYAASDVIATVRVTQRLFRLFKEKLKLKTHQLILDFIESLEPTLERDQRSRPPVVPSTREWLTIQPPVKDLDTKSKQDHRQRQSIIALKTNVSPRVKEAWEFWYHQGMSIEECAKTMKIKPTSVAIYLGKMLIHLNLNSMTLNDYFLNKLKTAHPNDDLDNAKIPGQAHGTDDMTKTDNQAEKGFISSSNQSGSAVNLSEDSHEVKGHFKGTTKVIEETGEVDIVDVRATDLTSVDLEAKNHMEEDSPELNIKDLMIHSNLNDPLPREENVNGGSDNCPDPIEPDNKQIDRNFAVGGDIDPDGPGLHIGASSTDPSVGVNPSIPVTESRSHPENRPVSMAESKLDPSEDNPELGSTLTDTTACSNQTIQSIENSLIADSQATRITLDTDETTADVVEVPAELTVPLNLSIEPIEIDSNFVKESNLTAKGAIDISGAHSDTGSAPTDPSDCINPPIGPSESRLILGDKTDRTTESDLGAAETNLDIEAASTNPTVSLNQPIKLVGEDLAQVDLNAGDQLDVGQPKLDISMSPTDQIDCINRPIPSLEGSLTPENQADPTRESGLLVTEPNAEFGTEPNNPTDPMAGSELYADEPNLEIAVVSTDQIATIDPPIGQSESILIPEREAGPPENSALHAENSSRDFGMVPPDQIGCLNLPIQPTQNSLDIENQGNPSEKNAFNPDESNRDLGKKPMDHTDHVDTLGKPLQSGSILERKIGPEPKCSFDASEANATIRWKKVTPAIRNVPMEITFELKMKMESIGAWDPKSGSIQHDYYAQLHHLNQSKLDGLKSLVLKFHVHETLRVDLKTFGFV